MSQHNLFIDIHILQSVPPSCINRDDAGSPKSAIYGGVRRHRVSSQAWKRSTRADFEQYLDESSLGERTSRVIPRIADAVQQLDDSIDRETAIKLATDVMVATGVKLKDIKKDEKEAAEEKSSAEPAKNAAYLVFLSRKQIKQLAEVALESHSTGNKISKKQAHEALGTGNSIDIALFGRMLADAPELNSDATCQVSHALSVGAAPTEFDYYTAVDDNSPEDNAGAGMIGTIEYTSSTLYRYATINATRLIEELESVDAAERAVDAFVRSFALSMPTGKQNTFANRTRPDVVVVTVRDDQPVNLVGAFEQAIVSTTGYVIPAAKKLADVAVAEDEAYGTQPVSVRYLATKAVSDSPAGDALNAYGKSGTFAEVVESAVAAVRSAGDQS